MNHLANTYTVQVLNNLLQNYLLACSLNWISVAFNDPRALTFLLCGNWRGPRRQQPAPFDMLRTYVVTCVCSFLMLEGNHGIHLSSRQNLIIIHLDSERAGGRTDGRVLSCCNHYNCNSSCQSSFFSSSSFIPQLILYRCISSLWRY